MALAGAWALGCASGSDTGGQDASGTGAGVAGAAPAGTGVAGSPALVAGTGVIAAGQGGAAPAAGAGGVGVGGPGGGGDGAPLTPVGGASGVEQPAGGEGGAAGQELAGTGGAGAGAGGAAGGGVDTPTAVPCTGKPGGNGNETRMWNGVQYIVHFPASLDPNQPVPLIFVDHGFTMSGALMQSLTGFDAVADREGFVVAYPNGDGGAFPWNVGVGACAPGGLISAGAADSIGYHEAMMASIEESQCIHPGQVFVTGFSMGGYFAHHMGCQAGNSFARAVGPHSGGTYPGDCPGAPVPIFIMHGAADTFIDHNLCGKGARDLWLPRNGCSSQFETRPVSGGNCEWYMGCDPNGQTVYCEFDGVGHAWASGATAAVWDFFKAYL